MFRTYAGAFLGNLFKKTRNRGLKGLDEIPRAD